LAARAEVVDLTTLAARAGQPAPLGRHLAFLGTRCWMRSCDAEGEHPACARLRRRFRLTPLIERRVQAPVATLPWPFADEISTPPAGRLRDLDFPWCVARGPMTIGLYRLEARR